MDSIKTVFMGSPESVIPVLEKLLTMGIKIAGVFTNPDKKSGRGRKLMQTPVKQFAIGKGLDVFTPSRLEENEQRIISELAPDLIVLAAYGKLIPPAILNTPRMGCLNIHPSILPRHRGASPVASTILAGDAVCGTSVIRMDEGLDTGPVVAQEEMVIKQGTDTPELTKDLFILGARLLADALPGYLSGEIEPKNQSAVGVTVTQRLSKADGWIDWTKPAVTLEREIRAYAKWPGSVTVWKGKRLQILRGAISDQNAEILPGTIVQLSMKPFAVGVATGDGTLKLAEVKLEGRETMDAEQFAMGQQEFLGSRLPNYE